MKLIKIKPKQAINKAFLSHRIVEQDFSKFTANLKQLLDNINEEETEENQKNPVRDFLKHTFYTNNEVNTKGKIDLAIHNGATAQSPVAVIIEVKRPTNKAEWISVEKPNGKALQELVLYYLRERIESQNTDIQYLIATNVHEWYIIDAKFFETFFYENKKFKKEYEAWRDGKKSSTDTSFFYNEIAKPFIENLEEELPAAFFDLRDYNTDSFGVIDKSLIELYKILAPQQLLRVPFANDSNELNEDFYKELLHIIGLEEVKDGGKSIIKRKVENRNTGSLLELVIDELKTEGLHKVPDIQAFGITLEERQFNVALELCITWVNRILFLKLLEGQLLSYHDDEQTYRFLNSKMIHDFDELFKLFHKVLAINVADRNATIQQKYAKVPYLNSSLFEISDLEDCTIKINALDNSETLPFATKTVLIAQKNKKENITSLAYLFQFLDAYDFSGEGSESIQKDNKALINASVLGKVFEKINGYKDGSVYTPAFITMYMCQQSLRMAIVEKFNNTKDWNCLTFKDLQNKNFDIQEANDIVNSLKICDPAVGSGHFLVSALNEILLIKQELGILCDKDGLRLKNYDFEIINDELIVTEDHERTRYNPKNKESQRLQETLFREKQLIIENCLFGVDINPNSVKICRLRLWIELLKNAYYRELNALNAGRVLNPACVSVRELETLPNIDINIKCGNSLLSRFALDADLSKALKSIKYDVAAYRGFVQDYKNCKDRDAKRGLQQIIDSIKSDFRTEIFKNDPKLLKLNKLGGELYNLTSQIALFEDAKTKKIRLDKIAKIEPEINKLTKEMEDIKTNATFKNAFEWRFEFPEVLDDEGGFNGFDVVIGNPPYIQLQSMGADGVVFANENYETYTKMGDIYSLFYEKGNQILKEKGILSFITSNKWMRADYGSNTRKYLAEKTNPLLLIDFGMVLVFDNAAVLSNILAFQKTNNQQQLDVVKTPNDFDKKTDLAHFVSKNSTTISVSENAWVIQDKHIQAIKSKVEAQGIALKDWDIKINRGVLTGFNEAFIIDEKTKNELIAADAKSAEILSPLLRGKDVKRWQANFAKLWLINSHNGVKETGLQRINTEKDYPTIHQHLLKYEKEINKRTDKGDTPFNLRNCAYIEDFNKPKIVYVELSKNLQFLYDEEKYVTDKTCFIITGKEDLRYLSAFLNSKLFRFCFKDNFSEIMGETRVLSKVFFEQIPIKQLEETAQAPFIELVEQILHLKSTGGDTVALEEKIDVLVYDLYDLSREEREIVKGR